jgi:hypothetical protein
MRKCIFFGFLFFCATLQWHMGLAQAEQQNPGSNSGIFWRTLGNAGTVDGTNFIGTTDNVPFNVRVNNLRAGQIDHLRLNTFWGYRSGEAVTVNALRNVGVGFRALVALTDGDDNVAVGNNALFANQTGTINVAVGSAALQSTTASRNVGVGHNALFSNTTGTQNVGLGSFTLYNNSTGSFNTGLGDDAANRITTASGNTAVGQAALYRDTTGSSNTAVGRTAMINNYNGSNNVAVGFNALGNHNSGSGNTAVGYNAATGSSTGNNNSSLGINAGGGLTTGSNNVFLGGNTGTTLGTITNATAIGFGTSLVQNNTVILGTNADVGIGTNVPARKLHVSGLTTGVRLEGLSTGGSFITAPSAATDKLLFADAAGDVRALASGTTGQQLILTATGPAWQTTTDWRTTGNAGTVASTNFIGTTDNIDFVTRTNNTEAMRVTNAGRVGIGTAAPATRLDVSSGTADAVYGHSNNVGAYLGYETNFSFGVPAQNALGSGVYATNPAANYGSVFAQSTGAATTAASAAYSNVWIAQYNLVNNSSATANPSASSNVLTVSSSTLGGGHSALFAYSDRGTTAGNPGFTIGVDAIADAQNQDAFGVSGAAYTDAGLSFGGAFEGLSYAGVTYAYAYVGGTPNGVTARKILGTGTVSEIVPTARHGRVTLTAPESPEYWYQEFGSVQMMNGKAHIELDPITADIVVVDAQNPIRAFCTPADMPQFNGVTTMNQTATGIDVVELNGGQHNGTLHYMLTLKPKTNYGEGRYPQAPGPSYLKADKEPQSAKAANNPADGRSVFRWPADHVVYQYNPEDMTGPGDVVPAGPQRGMYKMPDGSFSKYVPYDRTRPVR